MRQEEDNHCDNFETVLIVIRLLAEAVLQEPSSQYFSNTSKSVFLAHPQMFCSEACSGLEKMQKSIQSNTLSWMMFSARGRQTHGDSWRSFTAALIQLIWSSKHSSVSSGEMPEAQQANVFHPQIPGKCCANTLRGKALLTRHMWLSTVKMSQVSPWYNCIITREVTPEINWPTNLVIFHEVIVNAADEMGVESFLKLKWCSLLLNMCSRHLRPESAIVPVHFTSL